MPAVSRQQPLTTEEDRLLLFRVSTGLAAYIRNDYADDIGRLTLDQLGERLAVIALDRARETHVLVPRHPGQMALPLAGGALVAARPRRTA